MARQKQFDQTEALEAMMYAFWAKGFDGTSLQDLEHATGLTRTSIYHSFGNKREVFEQAISHYADTLLGGMVSLLDEGENIQQGVRKLLYAAVDHHFQPSTPGGCLVVLSLLECEQHASSSSEKVLKIVRQLHKAFQQQLMQHQQHGKFPQQLDPGVIATTILTTIQGIMVMGKAGFSRPALRKVCDTVAESLFARK